MTALTWPTLTQGPKEVAWTHTNSTQAHAAPFTGGIQTQSLPSVFWATTLQFAPQGPADATRLDAFLASLRGRAGRVAMWNMARERPRGVGGGSPVVAGAGQTGASLNISGGPASTTGWLLAGDYVGVGGRILLLAADVNTDGAGLATLTFTWPLRGAPSDASAITLVKPTCPMMLVDDTQGYTRGLSQRVPRVVSLREVP